METASQEITPNVIERDRRILELLSRTFPNVSAASTEIINLEAILNLPKGTEHFVADLHGEYEAFQHILRNASGNIKRKVSEVFGTSLRESELKQLCSLIYYPERKLQLLHTKEKDLNDFYFVTLHQLIKICRAVSSKYTRSKVRKTLPREFSYIIEELLNESPSDYDKQAYFNRILETIISTGQADSFIIALCYVIQKLSIDQLHILGDIFDRGNGAHQIMDMLLNFRSFDIQWGNHDILWMGASTGNDACIANVLRLSLRYGNMTTLEDGYGINLVPLATFAMETYGDDTCECFTPVVDPENEGFNDKSIQLMAKMHKAITIIQFKLEGKLIDKYPQWNMADRKLLEAIDFKEGTVKINDKMYPLKDTNFPTIDPADPYRLTVEEEELVAKLHHSFAVSNRLRKHMKCLLTNGSLFGIYNSNLLFHASMPLNNDGSLKEMDLWGEKYKGKELYNNIERNIRLAFNDSAPANLKDRSVDYFWYLWCGPESILFDKSKMATFERYFINDEETHKESKGNYYQLCDNEQICNSILDAFGVKGEHRHIINGHIPVKTNKGESPIKANGRLMVIDGGFAKAYHHTTGIAGYTLVYHSRGFELVQHEPFSSAQDAIINGNDIRSSTQLVEMRNNRIRVRDTDKGKELQEQIDELKELLYAFNHGMLPQNKRLPPIK